MRVITIRIEIPNDNLDPDMTPADTELEIGRGDFTLLDCIESDDVTVAITTEDVKD